MPEIFAWELLLRLLLSAIPAWLVGLDEKVMIVRLVFGPVSWLALMGSGLIFWSGHGLRY